MAEQQANNGSQPEENNYKGGNEKPLPGKNEINTDSKEEIGK
jgi:hypothetical protein